MLSELELEGEGVLLGVASDVPMGDTDAEFDDVTVEVRVARLLGDGEVVAVGTEEWD